MIRRTATAKNTSDLNPKFYLSFLFPVKQYENYAIYTTVQYKCEILFNNAVASPYTNCIGRCQRNKCQCYANTNTKDSFVSFGTNICYCISLLLFQHTIYDCSIRYNQ